MNLARRRDQTRAGSTVACLRFVQGTDPEAILVLEAVRQSGRPHWQFGFARATSGGLEASSTKRLSGRSNSSRAMRRLSSPKCPSAARSARPRQGVEPLQWAAESTDGTRGLG